jgi:hypothetical protein
MTTAMTFISANAQAEKASPCAVVHVSSKPLAPPRCRGSRAVATTAAPTGSGVPPRYARARPASSGSWSGSPSTRASSSSRPPVRAAMPSAAVALTVISGTGTPPRRGCSRDSQDSGRTRAFSSGASVAEGC